MSVVAKIVSTFDEKGFAEASKATETMGGKLGKFAKVAGTAFAAAGAAAAAYGVKLAIDGVKSAIEDEAAQKKLAIALKNVTGATDKQIASVEDSILQMSLATGVADDKLRPAFERLTRSTKDISAAQKMMNLALDIAAGTGKDVTTVAIALAKANDGQTTSLKKLGITLGENAQNYALLATANKELVKAQDEANAALAEYGPKSSEYSKALAKVADVQDKVNRITAEGVDWQGELAKEFAGAASSAADTFAGKMARLNVAFDEAKETVGGYILDAITPLVEIVVSKVIPTLMDWSDVIGKTLQPVFKSLGEWIQTSFIPTLQSLWNYITNVVVPAFQTVWPKAIELNKSVLADLNSILGHLSKAINIITGDTQDASKQMNSWVLVLSAALDFASKLIGPVLKLANAIGWVAEKLAEVWKWLTKLKDFAGGVFGAIGSAIGSVFGGGRAMGGPVTAGTTYMVGERGPELFTPSTNGTIIPNGQTGGGITINISGALDPEAVARQIQQILQRSAIRTGSYNNLGFSPVGLASA